jgi:aryl-alcohol dehydrogenase-like predicted oxidoreductase
MEQPQYNMFWRDRVEEEYGRLYEAIGLGMTIWSPLASGILTGKYNASVPDDSRMALAGYEWLNEYLHSETGQEQVQKTRELSQIAQELGTTMANLALAWCLKNPHVSTVITGASRVSQVQENMKAIALTSQLTDDVMDKIEAVLGNKPQSRHAG